MTREDLHAWELRMEDAYEKLHHLYDRTRKRSGLLEPAPPPGPDPATLGPKERKALLRLRWAQRRRIPPAGSAG